MTPPNVVQCIKTLVSVGVYSLDVPVFIVLYSSQLSMTTLFMAQVCQGSNYHCSTWWIIWKYKRLLVTFLWEYFFAVDITER